MGYPAGHRQSEVDERAELSDSTVKDALKTYWYRNLRLMLRLLSIWAVGGLGCGILFADALNTFKLGGYPLGFWFAQQGSVLVFVAVVVIYCFLMNRVDRGHHRDLERAHSKKGES